MFITNEEKIRDLAGIVKTLTVKPDFIEMLVPKINAGEDKRILAYLVIVTICHQTQGAEGISRDGRKITGNPFLIDRISNWAETSEEILPGNFNNVDSKGLAEILSNSDAEHCVFREITRRLELLRATYKYFEKHSVEDLKELGRIPINEIYAHIKREFGTAFSTDPMMKKASYFIMLMHLSGIWKDIDMDGFIPMVDYHKQRLMLRTGMVRCTDEEAKRKLKNKEALGDDLELRKACSDAFRFLGKYSGKGMMELSHIDWIIGRNCCRVEPACTAECSYEKCNLGDFLDYQCHGRCPLETKCDKLTAFFEPNVDTDFY